MIKFLYQICQYPLIKKERNDIYEIRKLVFKDDELIKIERYNITQYKLSRLYHNIYKNKIKFKLYQTHNLNDVMTQYYYNDN